MTLVRALMMPAGKNKTFVQVGQLKLVLTRARADRRCYVALVGWLGIYVSSVLFIALLHALARQVPVVESGGGVARPRCVAFFLIFEIWFKVPLPKGPLERARSGLG